MADFTQTEIEEKRAALWAEKYRAGMSLEDVFHLNMEIVSRFPVTNEERQEKAKHWERLPEFVL